MSDLIEFNPIDEITEMEDLRSLAKDQQAEIARLKIARIPHKDDDALGLALLNQFIDWQRHRAPDARKHLVGTITATTAPLRDEIVRLRRGLENACMCLGRIRLDQDASYAAEGHDKARATLEQKP